MWRVGALRASWALPLVALMASMVPMTAQGSLRAGQWHGAWIGAAAVMVGLVRPWPLQLVAGWSVATLCWSSSHGSWAIVRWTLAWSLIVTFVLRHPFPIDHFLTALRAAILLGLSVATTGLMDSRMSWCQWLAVTSPAWMGAAWWPGLLGVLFACWMHKAMGAFLIIVGLSAWRWWPARGGPRVLILLALACAVSLYHWREPIPERARELQSGRLAEWRLVLSGIAQHPWLGHGLGGWEVDARQIIVPPPNPSRLPWTIAHNDTLQAWYDGGLPMVASWSVALLALAIRITRRGLWAHPLPRMGVGYLAVSLYGFPWQLAPFAMLGALLFGRCWSLTQEAPC